LVDKAVKNCHVLPDKKLDETGRKEIITTTVTKKPYTRKLDLLVAVILNNPWVVELGNRST
jgi:hypothetical protein